MAVIVEHRVPIVITSLARARDQRGGALLRGVVLHDVINDEFARKASRRADGIIAVAAGAGGMRALSLRWP